MFSGFCLFPRRGGSLARFSFALLVGVPLATAGVFAAPPPSAAETPACKGDACRVLTPLLRSLTGAGPNCRGWIDVKFWKRAAAKDVRRCIARGYKVHARQRSGVAVLHIAAYVGKAETVKALIEAGADVEIRSRKHGSSPLHAAAVAGNVETLKALIESGAQIEAKEHRGQTPLHAAAFGGRLGTTRILLSSGARTDARDRFGQTPADLAMLARKTNVARIIRATRTPVAERPKPETKTVRAAPAPAPERKTEVRRSAPTGGRGCEGWLTADFWRRASEADVRRCLAAGSRLDARTARGSTPLHWAAYVNNETAVKALVAAGAKVDSRDGRNRTPAHSAASGNAEAAVRALIAAGADVSARSTDGRTPAEEARSKGRVRVANLLVASGGRAGAEPHPARKTVASRPAAAPVKTAKAPGSGATGGPDCKGWLRESFWKRASAADVERCIAESRQLDKRSGGWTALHWAAREDNAPAVKALIAAGANTEIKDYAKYTPLHLAAAMGSIAAIEAFVAAGVPVDLRSRQNRTPLHVAARYGKTDAVKTLLRLGTKTDAKSAKGMTALHVAARNGQLEVVKALLDAGADFKAREAHGHTPEELARDRRVASLLRAASGLLNCPTGHRFNNQKMFWVRAGAADIRDCAGRGHNGLGDGGCGAPLLLATAYGKPAAVQAVLAAGAKVNERRRKRILGCTGNPEFLGESMFEKTALHLAALRGDAEIVKILLAAGASVGMKDSSDRTALHFAAMADRSDALKVLLAAGANVHQVTAKNDTLLHLLVGRGDAEKIRLLLAAGAKPGARNDAGRAPLHEAVAAGNVEAIDALLAGGATVDLRNGKNNSALHMAAAFGKTQALKVLLRAGAKIEATGSPNGATPLHFAASGGHAESVKALLDAGANLHARDRAGSSALHLASQFGRADVVRALLAAGAPIEAKDPKGRTALEVAQTNRKTNVERALRAAGAKEPLYCRDWEREKFWRRAKAADVRRCLSEGKRLIFSTGGPSPGTRSALVLAAQYGREEAVTALLNAGAKADQRGRCGMFCGGNAERYTALHHAASRGHRGITRALVAAGADVTIRDRHNLTPLDLAETGGKPAVAQILSDARKRQYERMSPVARDCGNWLKSDFWKYGSAADVKRCVRAGRKVGARDKNGATRLHYAAYHGNVEMMKALLSSRAKVDSRREDGLTPLHIAARYGTPGAVDVLLDAKANAKAKTKKGSYPFDLAKKGNNKKLVGTDAYWRLNEALHE